jgi:hypothetical protein
MVKVALRNIGRVAVFACLRFPSEEDRAGCTPTHTHTRRTRTDTSASVPRALFESGAGDWKARDIAKPEPIMRPRLYNIALSSDFHEWNIAPNLDSLVEVPGIMPRDCGTRRYGIRADAIRRAFRPMPWSLPHRRGDGGGHVQSQHIVKNRILGQLSADKLKSVQPWLTPLELRSNVVLHEPGGEPIERSPCASSQSPRRSRRSPRPL